MNDIRTISGVLTTIPTLSKVDGAQKYQSQQSPGSYSGDDGDAVEISDRALILSKISQLPDIRQEKVEQLRKQLANGSYDVEGKLSVAIDKLFEEEAIF